jgi:hypothetical protein
MPPYSQDEQKAELLRLPVDHGHKRPPKGQESRSDPCISSVTTAIIITADSSVKRSERATNYPVFYVHTILFRAVPACEPTF